MIFAFGTRLLLARGRGDGIAKRLGWLPPLILAGLAVWFVVSSLTSWFNQALDTAEEAGVTGAVVIGQTQTLDQLKDANDAEQDLRRAPERDARLYAECLLDARRGAKAGCERHNPAPRIE